MGEAFEEELFEQRNKLGKRVILKSKSYVNKVCKVLSNYSGI